MDSSSVPRSLPLPLGQVKLVIVQLIFAVPFLSLVWLGFLGQPLALGCPVLERLVGVQSALPILVCLCFVRVLSEFLLVNDPNSFFNPNGGCGP
jgi:hypothetical protein